MKYLLKTILGFLLVSILILLLVLVKNFTDEVTTVLSIVVSAWMCYHLGDFIWNFWQCFFDKEETE